MLVKSRSKGDLILFTSLVALFVISSAIHQPILWVLLFALGIWGYVFPWISQYRVVKKSTLLLLRVASLVVASVYFIHCWSEPSYAVLLSGAQDFFAGQLTSAGDSTQAATVNLIFNVARGLFILYVVVAFVNAWNASRQDEDWVPTIKVPIITMLAVFSLDILTTMIIPAPIGG